MAEPEHCAQEQIVRHAEKTFGAEKAQLWLDRKTPALGGEAPRALLRTEEGRFAVERLLARVDHGLAS